MPTKPQKNEIERRTYDSEIRIEGEDKPKIVGHAAVFESLSQPMWGFVEKFAVGAFDDVLEDDVRGLFNHDPSAVLGRTKAGTMKVSIDPTGLAYEIDPPDTQMARDLITSMRRGDVTQSSLAFTVDEDKWDEDDEGRVVRTIIKVKRLFDVSPVTFPAYSSSESSVRGLAEFQESRAQKEPTPDPETAKRSARESIITDFETKGFPLLDKML